MDFGILPKIVMEIRKSTTSSLLVFRTLMMMIMVLCLMVYGCAEHHIRKTLLEDNTTLPNQLGKETNKPSMIWIFRQFQGVTVTKIQIKKSSIFVVLNLTDTLKRIIGYFGAKAEEIYA